MQADFGYYEEGHLGKPYDVRLLKRLYRFIRPYRKWFVLSILLALLTAAVDLSFPYLVKEAIDRYIVHVSYPVHVKGQGSDGLKAFGAIPLETTQDPAVRMIGGKRFKGMDPRARRRLIRSGVIEDVPFVGIRRDTGVLRLLKDRGEVFYEAKGEVYIPYRALKWIPPGKLVHLRASNLHGVALIALVYLALLLMGFVFQFFQVVALETMGQRVMQDLRVALYRHILHLRISFFDRTPVGRLVTRATNDIENLHDLFTAILVNQFKDLFILLGILGILFKIQFRLALYIVALLPVVILVSFLFSRWARDVFRDIRTLIGRINAMLQETLSGIRIIQIFRQESRFNKRFEEINHQTYLANIRQIKIFAFFMPLIEMIASFAMALILWRGGVGIMSGALSLGALVAFLSYIRMFFRPIRDISEKYNIMQSAMASTERIFQIMDLPKESERGGEAVPSEGRDAVASLENQGDFFEKDIVFSNVWFAYEDEKWVLKDLNVTFPAMKTSAIIGATGAGKTSMMVLLERFYVPQKGRITIGGVDLSRIPLDLLRQNVGLVQQEVQLFSGTLWENILLGISDPTRERARDVLERLGISALLERLPDGLDTRLQEEGRGISSGERQLISLARAFARDPRILILDEATASMDPFTEQLIQKALHVLLRGRTVIVIAHRLSTIRQADHILVLDDGRITESGTHDLLMRREGLYYFYYKTQNGD
ncbi:MAG: ABC transporter ATP-binding protein [Deltaproteobacteria bacterium]|nr:MAG: ABC transporter ATP-binding protein [Deltaproteobacteria bacterium]